MFDFLLLKSSANMGQGDQKKAQSIQYAPLLDEDSSCPGYVVSEFLIKRYLLTRVGGDRRYVEVSHAAKKRSV
jgi:hypothetical protein